MNSENDVTVLVVGDTGAGKSQNGCAFLQKNGMFEANSKPQSCTYKTSAQSRTINGIRRNYIDTQGLEAHDGLDAEYIQQMVSFLKEWKKGINAFFLVINGQNPRFDQGIQKMIKLMNDFFNNPDFWNQTGIIFTRCYEGKFDKEIFETEYHKMVKDFIKSLPGCELINPQIPCFFVDSKEWETEESTKFQYIRIFEFAHKNPPVSTQKLQIVRPDYKSKEEEILEKVFVGSEMVGEDEDRKQISHYEDQRRYKITGWDGKVTYTDPETIDSYTEEKLTIVTYETKTEKNEKQEDVTKTIRGSRPFLGLIGHRPRYQVHDYYLNTTTYTEYERRVLTFPDGEVQFGEWEPTGKEEVETYKS